MRDDAVFFLALSFLIMGVAAITIATLAIHQDSVNGWWRDELARRGHAHYYLDQNNERQWNWKEQQ